ncbi:MAG: nicotinate phosphoribosyltransferase [Coriobacteriaceae bacterium]|nr:nicotinate phosphoribosyltransferase [Coriobacteriaceae bacterium]
MARNLTLLCDLYQLAMAQGYWQKQASTMQACFYVFYRENPYKGGYAIVCGADQIAHIIDGFRFTDEDIEYLRGLPSSDGGSLFDSAFLDWLGDLELSVDVDIVPDGTPVFPREPLVRVTGSLLQCQLLETAILNGLNFQTLIATKATRVCYAAQGRPIAEFGLRRAQGPDGGMSASRAAYIGGCASTSNVLAGKEFGIPVSGTNAHSWVMSFPDELTAFRAYAASMPHNCVLLVDTYDVEQGVANAITVGQEMAARGEHLAGIRIDSGDLAWLSKRARAMLDEAGLGDVGIVGSNDLDEYTITSLIEQGACFDSFGVGTRLSCGEGESALGGVYKLSAIREDKDAPWQPRIKVSEQSSKLTIPGILNTRRYFDEDGKMIGDLIYDEETDVGEPAMAIDPLDESHRKKFEDARHETLLVPLARAGAVLQDFDLSVQTARTRCDEQLNQLDASIRRFMNPHWYPAGIERNLFALRNDMVERARGTDSLY